MHNFRIRTEYLMHSEQRFNHYATIGMPSVLRFEYEWYVYFFIVGHLVVPDVLRQNRRAFRSCHDIACSGLQTDLPLEELSCRSPQLCMLVSKQCGLAPD